MGLETCRQLGKLGYTVILGCRKIADGQEAAAGLKSEKLDIVPHALDTTSEDSIITLLNFVNDQFGRLDVLINNGGVLLDHRSYKGEPKVSIFDTTRETLMRTMDTNVNGPFLMCKHFIPVMMKNGYGRVVNISSRLGQLSKIAHGTPCYRLSKTALNGVTRIFADETAGTNILVNSACPGWAKTDMGGPNAYLLPEQAVDTIIWLATLSNGGPTGAFFGERQQVDW